MSDPYVSSIVNNYGDMDNAQRDIKTLHEILGRQGSYMLLEVVAESTGRAAIKFKLKASTRNLLVDILVGDLRNALDERL